jgi:hypothetical protein
MQILTGRRLQAPSAPRNKTMKNEIDHSTDRDPGKEALKTAGPESNDKTTSNPTSISCARTGKRSKWRRSRITSRRRTRDGIPSRRYELAAVTDLRN